LHYILFYDLVEDYVTKRETFRGDHLRRAQEAFEKGDLVLGGALSDPADVALLVFNGPTPAAAEAFAKADPYVVNHLVKSWRVRKWMTVVGEGLSPP
jgi:uncharacterized protein YciI